jgi:succinate dehydrogenase (ubiquinone) cytochrome b560 subunit
MFRATSTTVAKFASRHYYHPSSNNTVLGGIANNNNIVYSNIIDKQQQQQQQQQRSMTILSKESKVEYAKQNYSSRLAQTGRPVSPHVTIYAFPACALSSITTRVTGIALSFGSVSLGMVELIGGNGAAANLMSSIGSTPGIIVAPMAKFVVAFPLVYHYLGGLRHYIWDNNPDMLSNVDVEKASYVLVGTSVVLSAGTMFM